MVASGLLKSFSKSWTPFQALPVFEAMLDELVQTTSFSHTTFSFEIRLSRKLYLHRSGALEAPVALHFERCSITRFRYL